MRLASVGGAIAIEEEPPRKEIYLIRRENQAEDEAAVRFMEFLRSASRTEWAGTADNDPDVGKQAEQHFDCLTSTTLLGDRQQAICCTPLAASDALRRLACWGPSLAVRADQGTMEVIDVPKVENGVTTAVAVREAAGRDQVLKVMNLVAILAHRAFAESQWQKRFQFADARLLPPPGAREAGFGKSARST